MSEQPITERPVWLAPLDDPKSEMILRAAFDVFQECGLHSATMLDVARRAKVSKETLYARFDSKEGLFYAILAWGCRKSALDPDMFPANDADPVGSLRDYALAMAGRTLRPECVAIYRMAVSEAGRNPDLGRVYDEMSYAATEEYFTLLLPMLRARGIVDEVSAAEFTHTLCGLVRGNYQHAQLMGATAPPSDEDLERWANRAVDLSLRAHAPLTPAHAIAAE